MTPTRILVPSLLALAIVSCAPQQETTPTAAAGPASAPATEPANPVYDTPAAYEASGTTPAPTANAPSTPATASVPNKPMPPVPAASSNGAAIIHTVVAGDTLSGISAKYKVPVAAIKQANNMTKDTVILGRKMVIPPAR